LFAADSGFISPKKDSEGEEGEEVAEILARQAAIDRVDDLFKIINTVSYSVPCFINLVRQATIDRVEDLFKIPVP
jgi:hypothetical protein